MNLICKASGGKNIVCRPMARPAYYPARTVQPSQVEVYQRYDGEPPAAARKIGSYAPGMEVSVHYNPIIDKDIILSTISIAPDGTRSVRELADAHEETLVFQRETAAPTIGQNTDATADSVTVGVMDFTMLVTKRRLKKADALTGGGALDSPTEQIFDYGPGPVPLFIDIARAGTLIPAFTYSGNDPAANGFTKTGSGTVELNAGGWRINTLTTDAATYYSKTSWPAGAFANGFTLELTPPTVPASDSGSPADSVCLQIDDGSHRFKLSFDAGGNAALNGGSSHAHGGSKIRLVVAVGGATADLWIGDTLTEVATAAVSTSSAGLIFGDLTGAADADAVWPGFVYQLSRVPVRAAQTIYVAVAHSSGGGYTPDSNILALTFANETTGDGGSSGEFDPTPKDNYEIP